MKQKKIIILTILIILLFNIKVFATENNINPAIFMGEIVNIEQSENNDAIRVTIRGYIKGCEVYKEEIIGIITNDTYIIPSTYNCNENELNLTKVNVSDFKIKKGNIVFCILDEAMTKSIPPQVRIKAIQISPQD